MIRIFFTYVLPLTAPLLIYLGWHALARAKARKHGAAMPNLEKGGVFWSIVAGFVLLVASLLTLAVVGGADRDAGRYVPPRLEDGRVLPPRFEKDPAAQGAEK